MISVHNHNFFRRGRFSLFLSASIAVIATAGYQVKADSCSGIKDRTYWVESMLRIVSPQLVNGRKRGQEERFGYRETLSKNTYEITIVKSQL